MSSYTVPALRRAEPGLFDGTMKVRLVYCWQHGRVTVVGKGVILLAGRAAAIENSNWRPPSQRDDCRLYTTNRVEDAADGSGKVREREGGMMKKKKKFLFFFFFYFFLLLATSSQCQSPTFYIVSPYIQHKR